MNPNGQARAEEAGHNGEAPARATVSLEDAYLEAQAQRLRYQELFEFSTDGFLLTDRRGLVLEANRAAVTLLSCRKEFLLGKPLGLFLERETRPAFYRGLARVASGNQEEPLFWEGRLCRPKEQGREVVLVAAAVPAEGDRPASLRWLVRDVSLARQAERALREARQFADSVLDGVEAFILVVDGQGRVMRSNPCLRRASGCQGQELLGREWAELLIAPEDRPAARALAAQARAEGTAPSALLAVLTRAGGRRAVAWSARALEGGRTVVLLGHDVTELREAQARALQAERLAAIGQASAALAHEGRNALQRLQANLTLLGLRLAGQPEALELVDRAQQAQDDLLRLFEDVRAYAAPLTLRPVEVDLAAVWREAWAELLAARPEGPPAELVEGEPGASATGGTGPDTRLRADPFHLKRLFRNLFDNALGVGARRVVVSCGPAQEGGLRVSVRDNGPGLAEEHRERAFEPFFSTRPRGTGLGLAICRRIVEAHGGHIALAPGPGPGAEVLFTLPRREQ